MNRHSILFYSKHIVSALRPGTERDDGHAVLLQELWQLPAGLQQVHRLQDPHPGRPPQRPDLGQRGHVRLRGREQSQRPEAAGAVRPY